MNILNKLMCCTILYANTHLYADMRYVLTGGPGVGKSSTIERLARSGQQTVQETYTILYEKAAQENKLDIFLNVHCDCIMTFSMHR